MRLTGIPPVLVFIALSRHVRATPTQAASNLRTPNANHNSNGTPAGGQRPKTKPGTAAGKAAMRGMGEAKTSAVKAWAEEDEKKKPATATAPVRPQGQSGQAPNKKENTEAAPTKDDVAAKLQKLMEETAKLTAELQKLNEAEGKEGEGYDTGDDDPAQAEVTEDSTDVAEQLDPAAAGEPEGEQEQQDGHEEEEDEQDDDDGGTQAGAKAEQRMRQLLAEAEDEGTVGCAGCLSMFSRDKDPYKGLTAEKLQELIQLQKHEKEKAEENIKSLEETKKIADKALTAVDDLANAKKTFNEAQEDYDKGVAEANAKMAVAEKEFQTKGAAALRKYNEALKKAAGTSVSGGGNVKSKADQDKEQAARQEYKAEMAKLEDVKKKAEDLKKTQLKGLEEAKKAAEELAEEELKKVEEKKKQILEQKAQAATLTEGTARKAQPAQSAAAPSNPAKVAEYESLKADADKAAKEAEELEAKLKTIKDAKEKTTVLHGAQEARLKANRLTDKAEKAKKAAYNT